MFVHLHCHTIGSFSDSTLYIEDAVKKAAADGQYGLAVTDHGMLNQPFHFIKTCKKYGINPLIGCEINFVGDAHRTILNRDNDRFHLVLIAKNDRGVNNLISIINQSWEENNFWDKRGLVDWKILQSYHEGLICLTGCFWNIVARQAEVGSENTAEENFKKFYDIFGKDLYCELSRHNVEAEEKANELMLKLAKKYSVKPVLTNDVHYLNKSDVQAHDCYIKSRFEKLSSFSYDGEGFDLKTIRQMKELGFKEEYLENTLEVAHKCSVEEGSFKKGDSKPTYNSLEKALQSGKAAYIPAITTVAEQRAKDICRKLDKGPEEYKKLVGLWRRVGINTKRIAVSGSPRLNEITPVFMHQGKRVCQLSEKELSCQGIEVIDA